MTASELLWVTTISWVRKNRKLIRLASSLTLADQQKNYFLGALRDRFPDLVSLYEGYYPPASYSPRNYPWPMIAQRIGELCKKYGIRDRIPRPIIPGEKRALNKRVVELLADQLHEMELNAEPDHRLWAYRKAAWAVEDMPEDIGLVYRTLGLKGLQNIPNVGQTLGMSVEGLLCAGNKITN